MWPYSESELYQLSDPRLSAKLEPKFSGKKVSRYQRNEFPRPYSRLPRPEPLFFLLSSS
jgi:hypothetical protein